MAGVIEAQTARPHAENSVEHSEIAFNEDLIGSAFDEEDIEDDDDDDDDDSESESILLDILNADEDDVIYEVAGKETRIKMPLEFYG